ncbi:MAG: amidohydrolase [Clostridiales bacterium]|nr:amidohydrolase [Clostridiales bacterium]
MERILLHHCRALLMDQQDTLLEGAYVAVEGDKILSVGTQRPQGDFAQEIDCGNNVLMPGLVNAHTHIPMTLLRGYGGGCDLQTWLNQWIFPAEAKLDNRAVAAGAGLALAELIAGGVTTIADMYMFTPAIAQTVLEAGISANLSCGGVYFGAPADFGPATCKDCENQRILTEEWHGAGNGQILVDASIHGEYTSNVPLWQWMADYAQKKGLGMHVHVSETQAEHEACKQRWGKTPFQILDRYGVWDTRAIAAHCVWTTEEDWAGMAEKGVSCVHNPVSNLKLGSGVAWIPAMKQAGVNIALGTDGVSSNNNLDMFEEMKFAAVLHNGVTRDPLALLPRDVLAMATRDGAKALGRKTGQIAPGYAADLILVDFTRPSLTPCHSVPDNLVYSARGSDVVMNMARGKIIYKDGTFLTLDLEKIQAEVGGYALPLLFGGSPEAL